MKSYKVTNLTESYLVLNSSAGLGVKAEETAVLSHEEYSTCHQTIDSFSRSGWAKLEIVEKKVKGASDAETNPDAAKVSEQKKELKAKLVDLQAEFKKKETSAARKEEIALEVEKLKEEAKKLK